jgi:2-hydroxy-4-carboxymuconate semialdehyde hemiacetal dehydrogenase
MTVRVCVAGCGAIGVKHLEALAVIEEVRVVALVEPNLARAGALAARFGVDSVVPQLEDVLARRDVDAVILCTPTSLHAHQAILCLQNGKHVQAEIPLAEDLESAQRVADEQRRRGLIGMVGHTRRYNPGHQWVHRRLVSGELSLRHLEVQTHFLRRSNLNALGEPRSWTDHLLWHHACHTVDLFQYQTGEMAATVGAIAGPMHSELGIAMDMAIQLAVPGGAICSLALSFNHDGPFGTTFRYITDAGTYVAHYDELTDGHGRPVDLDGVDVSLNGIELQDRAFAAAIRTGVPPLTSFDAVLPAYATLDRIERLLQAQQSRT